MPAKRLIAFIGILATCIAVACMIRFSNRTSGPVAIPQRIASSLSNEATRSTIPTLSGSEFQTEASTLEPGSDWVTESIASSAAATLESIKQMALHGVDVVQLSKCFSDQFVCGAFDELLLIHETPSLTVRRREASADTKEKKRLSGTAGVDAFLRSLLPSDAASSLSLKLIAIQQLPESIQTTLRAEAASQDAEGASQQHSHWSCVWEAGALGTRLISADPIWVERVDRKGDAWFEDQTEQVIGRTEAFQRQLSKGLQHWLARIETAHGMSYFSKHGLAVGDVNGDGLEDVYVCQPGGLPNRLFMQNAEGELSDVSEAYGVDLLDRTSSAVFVDLDNDGDQDLALATLMGIQVFENVDGERFRRRTNIAMADIDLQGISAADYDNDGDLDLYQLVDYATDTSRSRQGLPSFVYHNANDGGANRLYQNNISSGKGDWVFTDVTEAVGLNHNNQRHSLAAAWCDINDDGHQDLYVANDYGPNCLYINKGGYFEELAETSGVADFGSGMSVSWGDYDRDGASDLYVGNMFSSAGSRITPQAEFLSHVSAENREIYQRFAQGNSLFRNLGDGTFGDVSTANVEMGRWSWSSLFADVNNDGWEDLLVANGYITTEDTGDL